MTLGRGADLVGSQIELLARLGDEHSALRSGDEGLALLRRTLADRRCLLVVDDVWSTAAAAAFCAAGPQGRVLYTTRDTAVLNGIGAAIKRIDVLPDEAARELLRRLTRLRELPPETDAILEQTGRIALAVALVAAAVGAGQHWTRAVEQLDRGADTFGDHPYANAFKAMQVAVSALDDDDARAFRTLALFPRTRSSRSRPFAGCGPIYIYTTSHQSKRRSAFGFLPRGNSSRLRATGSPSTISSARSCSCTPRTSRSYTTICWTPTGPSCQLRTAIGRSSHPTSLTSGST